MLLEAWRAGDQEAGNELFERHYAGIARFFHNKVSEPAQDDLTQKTFLACLTNVAQFRGQSRFRTFLFGIANNVLVDYIRQLKRRMPRPGSETDVDEAPAEDLGISPVATAEQHQEQRLLLKALRRIPLIHQVALELYYWEDLTTAEISDVLGVPVGTVRTRLRDGRANLEAQLRELASSPEALRSTTDDLARWARRMRTEAGQDARDDALPRPDPGPDPDPEIGLGTDPEIELKLEADPELGLGTDPEIELKLDPAPELDDG